MFYLVKHLFGINEDTENSLLPFVLIPEVIFAGVEIPLKDYVLQTLAVFFPTRWAMAAVGTTVGLHADKIGGDKLFGEILHIMGGSFPSIPTRRLSIVF
ncbi:MAG: hypothetical protein NVS4B12_03700 [Ktedonobacteraceae bacterium]